MNKAKDGTSVTLAEKAVAGGEVLHKAIHAVEEILLSFTVVVDVDVDIGAALAADIGEDIEESRAIFVLGVIESVLGRASGIIGEALGNFGPMFGPCGDAAGGDLVVVVLPVGLEMVGDGDPDPAG